ncbi:MAG: hypothetical protein ONB12_10960 [candidate division KSB1 bacterium]|nr:hypothetical protein [candidate division KSB1 bacterium]
MIGLLTKTLVRIKLAPIRRRKKRITTLFAAFLISTLPLSIYFSMHGMFQFFEYMPEYGERAVHGVLSFSFAGLFLLMLFTGYGSALHHFFLADDLPLLLSLPIAPQAVFFVKYFECFLNGSATFIIFGAPVLIAFIQVSDGGAIMIATTFIASILFIAFTVALIQLIASATGALFDAARMRKYAVMIGSLFAVALWAGLQWIRFDRFTPGAPDFDPYAARKFVSSISNVSFAVFPSQQLVDGVFAVLHGNPAKAVLHMIVLGILAAVFLVGSIGWRIRQEPLRRLEVQTDRNRRGKWRRIEADESKTLHWRRVLLMKEFKIAVRDIRTRHVLLLFTVAMILWPLMQGHGNNDAFATKWAMAFFAAALSNILARQTIPQEREAFFYTKLAPLAMKNFVLAKAALTILLLGAALIPGQMVIAFKNRNLMEGLESFLIPLGCVILGTAVGLYTGARYGRFDWRDPRLMIGIGTGYLSMILSLTAAGIGLGLCLTAEFIGYSLAFGLFFLYVYAVFYTALALSQKHLSTMDWILTS